MFYLRLLIGVIFIILCTKLGKNKGDKYKYSANFYDSCLSFCSNFKGDLLYKKSKLEDFLNYQYSSIDFKEILNLYIKNQEIKEYPEYLTADEIREIDNFFSTLGKTDSVSQIEVIDAYKKIFESKLNEKNAEFKKYYKVSTKLGFIIGLGFMIMVI